MNILQLSKYYEPTKGGIELVAQQISKAFLDKNHLVSVVAFADENLERIGALGEQIVEVKQDFFLMSTPISFNFIFKFKKLILEQKIDRIYVHLPNPFMHEMVRKNKIFLIKNNVTIVGVYHSDIINKKFLGNLYQRYFLKTQHIYNSYICSSENLKQTSPVLKKILQSKVDVIPFCVEEKNVFKKRSQFQGNLLIIGRLVPYKGYEFLIDALTNSDFHLTIVGGGPLLAKLKKRLPPNIKILGDVSEDIKNNLLNQSDLLVVSSNSRAEAYGMTIVEAFQTGLPVIATQINTGVTFLVDHQKTGLTYPINDKLELLKQLTSLRNDHTLLPKLSEGCFLFYNANLKFELFQKKLLDL